MPILSGFADSHRKWVLVDTQSRTLAVMKGENEFLKFDEIAIGRAGTSEVHVLGDDTTPLGEFRITRINDESKYHRFFGFDYPTLNHVLKAHYQGVIDYSTFKNITNQMERQRVSPQLTALGGYIGIHGIGGGDLEVHEDYNWTNGCIALTNQQVDELTPYLKIGTKVVVR
ncbi:MAG: L,D-transpeptidase [Gammaproteobacteria bacterium]|nr:L,D-transpeptidase [Gammaproteobacteria bacterium]